MTICIFFGFTRFNRVYREVIMLIICFYTFENSRLQPQAPFFQIVDEFVKDNNTESLLCLEIIVITLALWQAENNVLCRCVKAVSPYAKLIHCRIHRKLLATKKIPTKVRAVLGPHSSRIFVLFCVFFFVCLCKCVLYYCHRVATQLQLTNMSISI